MKYLALAAATDVETWVQMARDQPEALFGAVITPEDQENLEIEHAGGEAAGQGRPMVVAHGMGDSCFNGGMKSITKALAGRVAQPAFCVPTGAHWASDTANGYFLGISESVDRFAKGIRSHPELANGFDAVGFSQGNSLIRGYIHKYNSPPVKRYLSVHGTVMGVSAIPGCQANKTSLCKTLSHALGAPAYTEFIQNHIFQAGYLRDPARLNDKDYKKNSELAKWNNEGDVVNSTYKTNFESVDKYIMVKALQDTMVEPKEGEWWGAFDSKGAMHTMKETNLYQEDLFGLKTVDAAGKVFFETTPGNHLQFTEAQLFKWVDQYLLDKEEAVVV